MRLSTTFAMRKTVREKKNGEARVPMALTAGGGLTLARRVGVGRPIPSPSLARRVSVGRQWAGPLLASRDLPAGESIHTEGRRATLTNVGAHASPILRGVEVRWWAVIR